MARTSETGHAKNVANFEELIGFCTSYGATYNPSKATMKVDALNILLTSAQAALATHKVALTALDNATNAREIGFKPLKKLCTRIVNALMATDATRQTIDDAQSSNFKIQGRRAKAKPEPKPLKEGEVAPSDHTISVSQQSFDGLIDNLAKLIQTVSADVFYKPNEAELQVATLNTLLTDLKAKNKDVITATVNESNARIARDKVLYAELAGLTDVSLGVKSYIKSLYGSTGAQYKQISKIKFTKSK